MCGVCGVCVNRGVVCVVCVVCVCWGGGGGGGYFMSPWCQLLGLLAVFPFKSLSI